MNPVSNRTLPLLTLLAGLLAPRAGSAQGVGDASARGLWWEVSAAAGGTRLACAFCDRSRELGPALDGAFGAYASDRVRVGVEGGGWTARDGNDPDDRETVYRAGVVVQLHPRPGSGLHVLGGLGWNGYRTGEETTYDAVRITLGAGWDLPLVGSWVVGNRVTLDASSFASLKDGDAVIARSVGLSVLRFGIYLRRR